jgi:hypothetical protein
MHQIFSVAGFCVLTVVVIKISILWDVTPCSLLKTNGHIGGTVSDCYLLHDGFVPGLMFDPEDENECSSKIYIFFNGIHGVIFRKVELFS